MTLFRSLSKNVARKIFVCIISVLVFSPYAKAQNWNENQIEITRFIETGDCENAWKIIWHWVKRKNKDAIYMLSESIYYGIIFPPGQSDFISLSRYAAIFSIYGFSDNESRRNKLENIMSQSFPKDIVKHSLDYCLEKETESECISFLLENNMIPRFDSVILEIENLSEIDGRIQCNAIWNDVREEN